MSERPLSEVVTDLRELDAGATPGPWYPTKDGWAVRTTDWDAEERGPRVARTDFSGDTTEREVINAELIAEARTALPRLLEAAEENVRLRAEVSAWREAWFHQREIIGAVSWEVPLSVKRATGDVSHRPAWNDHTRTACGRELTPEMHLSLGGATCLDCAPNLGPPKAKQ